MRCRLAIEQYLLSFARMLPVTPGTAHVTVGGALACDAHGKNHLAAGGFAQHVGAVEFERPELDRCRLDRERDPGDFRAGAYGLGLTGVILDATLRVHPFESGWMDGRCELCVTAEVRLASLTQAARHAAYTRRLQLRS